MDQYTEMYAWIRESFGDDEFSIDNLRSTFPLSQAPKIVRDLVNGGYLQRVKRGTYQAVMPDQLFKCVIERSENTKDVLDHAERPYAYSHSTAVAIWTSGYFWTGFTKGFKPFHIQISTEDLTYWQDFFKNHQARYAIEDENRTLFGFVYILHPQKCIEVAQHEGQPVIPLEDTVKFCLEREIGYQPALEYFGEHFGIDYAPRVSLET